MQPGRPGVPWWTHGIAVALLASAPAWAGVTLRLSQPDGTAASDVVLALAGGPSTAPAPRDTRPVVIDQRDQAFVPAVTVVQAGTEIAFPNNDATSHHVYSFSRPNAFELPLYKGDLHRPVRFNSPGIATLGCNIHDFMVGYVVVVDTPWFGQTNRDGSLVLDHLPPGRYQVTAWSQRLDRSRFFDLGTIDVTSGAASRRELVLPRGLRSNPVQASRALVRDAY